MAPDFLLVGRYPELRELELRQLARELLSSNSGPTLKLFKEKVKCYTHGELLHGGHVISTLYEFMESDESVEETPLAVTASVNHQVVGEDRIWLKRALTTSLASGTFLDSQFYAVESGSSTGMPKIRPIYFCSKVEEIFMFKLMACKSLARIRCGIVSDPDPPSQVPQNSGHEGRSPGERMGATLILTSGNLGKRILLSVTLVSNGSFIRFWSSLWLSLPLPAFGSALHLWIYHWNPHFS